MKKITEVSIISNTSKAEFTLVMKMALSMCCLLMLSFIAPNIAVLLGIFLGIWEERSRRKLKDTG